MARQELAQGFNKEKLVFLLAAIAAAAGVYLFVATSPLLLEPAPPHSSDAGPPQARDVIAPPPEVEDYYVVDGKTTLLMDKLTGQLVNRQRKTPFTPAADYLAALAAAEIGKGGKGGKGGGGPKDLLLPPPPPPPPGGDREGKKEEGKKKGIWNATDAESLVEYKGVIGIRGVTYGMLQPKDGTRQFNVQAGDMLPGLDYTVKLIEKQAITVADADGNIFLLRDLRYTESGLEMDSSPSGGKGDVADSGGKGGGGKGQGKDKAKHDKGGGGKKGGPGGKAGPPQAANQPAPNPPVAAAAQAGTGAKLLDKLQTMNPKVLEMLKAKLQGAGKGPPQ